MKVLQINTTVNSGSTGRIAEEIGKILILNNYHSFIAYNRKLRPSESNLLRIGTVWDMIIHVLKTRICDRHGYGSLNSTKKFIKTIKEINPDIIHLHNIHGYYLNIYALFKFLKEFNKPVFWTLHDCWAFTGHCTHFENVGCYKWHSECNHCPKKSAYPQSWFLDNSRNNFKDKKELFSGISDLRIVVPSRWLSNHVGHSFLCDKVRYVIYNGIDLTVFKPMNSGQIKILLGISDKKIILGVANVWQKSKGLDDFIEISKLLSKDELIVLVGLKNSQISKLPSNIKGISKSDNVQELAELYASANIFVNPTYSDNFPTTNIEALACGTPVITYNTGGSPEAIDENTGIVIEKGDINGLYAAIKLVLSGNREVYRNKCRQRAIQYFNKEDRYKDYLDLYEEALKN